MDTATHPTTTSELIAPVDLGSSHCPASRGGRRRRERTLRTVTRRVTVPLEAVVVSGMPALLVTGSFEIALADHDIAAPSAPIVLAAPADALRPVNSGVAPAGLRSVGAVRFSSVGARRRSGHSRYGSSVTNW